MKKACGKAGEIGVGKIHQEGLLQGPLQGRTVIEEGTRGKGTSGKTGVAGRQGHRLW